MKEARRAACSTSSLRSGSCPTISYAFGPVQGLLQIYRGLGDRRIARENVAQAFFSDNLRRLLEGLETIHSTAITSRPWALGDLRLFLLPPFDASGILGSS